MNTSSFSRLARIVLVVIGASIAASAGLAQEDPAPASAINVLLITVDDMNRDSVGVFGCELEGATPHIDQLASQGLRFEQAHVTIAICQPTRAVWMTGRYPHRNGALGFDPIDAGVPTLVEALDEAGYLTGLFAKERHVVPTRAAAFDVIVKGSELGQGRRSDLYGQQALAFFERAAKEEKPFFLMANAADPHRPFAGSPQEAKRRKRQSKNEGLPAERRLPDVENPFDPEEVPVPGFLPDLPPIRKEIAEYFTSVRRADATVGKILAALEESELADRTIVMFLSDHGMALPFAKTNCWRHSTITPWIVRWPGVVEPGSVDRAHVVAGIDMAPTILDALGLPPLEGADGASLSPILRGERQEGRDRAFTHINTLSSKRSYPMRSVQERRFGYIWNAWSDGETSFRNESQNGRTFRAMQAAAATDPAVAARIRHFQLRAPEELYDHIADPDSLHDLASDPAHAETLSRLRKALLTHMEETGDPQLPAYRAAWRSKGQK